MSAHFDWIVPLLIVLNVAAAAAWLATRRPMAIRILADWSRLAAMARGLGSVWLRLRKRARASELDSWIEEVEEVEQVEQAERGEAGEAVATRDSGSEHWWRAWAASGGSLPQAAETCRRKADVRRRSA